jgi:hypothetical protein
MPDGVYRSLAERNPMDQHTLSMEVFAASLTEAQLDTCESDEKRLGEVASEGLSEANAVRFARAMSNARRATPDAAVEAVFEYALKIGLSAIAGPKSREDAVKGAAKKRQSRKRVRGV